MYKIVGSSKDPLEGDTWQNSFLGKFDWVLLEKTESEETEGTEGIPEKPVRFLAVLDGNENASLQKYVNCLQGNSENGNANIESITPKVFECDVCKRTFKRKCNLNAHKPVHERIKVQTRPQCEVCQKTFFDSSTLHRHKKLHTGELPYQCLICHRTFSRKDNFSIHCKLHADGRTIMHGMSGGYDRHFLPKRRFAFRKKRCFSEAEKIFECETCHKKFAREHSLNIHRRIHLPFKCDVCNQSFSMRRQIIAHWRIHMGNSSHGSKVSCEVGKQTSHSSFGSLNNHAFQCDKCQKPFAVRSNLLEHERSHSGIKLFECDLCLKKFASRGNLNVHRRIHTGERPYQCQLCPRAFMERTKLVIHSRFHSGLKPYECMLCLKKFSRKQYLTCHYRIHTGEKPFECEICHRFFTESSARNRHQKTHYVTVYGDDDDDEM